MYVCMCIKIGGVSARACMHAQACDSQSSGTWRTQHGFRLAACSREQALQTTDRDYRDTCRPCNARGRLFEEL